MIAVHLHRADAERKLGGVGVAERTLGPAREAVILLDHLVADLDLRAFCPGPFHRAVRRRSGRRSRRRCSRASIGRRIPACRGIAGSGGCAGFEPLSALGIAAFHVHREGFHEHGAIGELPARRGAGGRLRIGDFIEADLAVAGDGDEAFLDGMIAPELGVDGIGNDAGGDLVILRRGERSRSR